MIDRFVWLRKLFLANNILNMIHFFFLFSLANSRQDWGRQIKDSVKKLFKYCMLLTVMFIQLYRSLHSTNDFRNKSLSHVVHSNAVCNLLVNYLVFFLVHLFLSSPNINITCCMQLQCFEINDPEFN